MERRDFISMSFWVAGAMKYPLSVGNLGIGSGTIDLDRLKLCADFVNAAFKSPMHLWGLERWGVVTQPASDIQVPFTFS